MPAEKFGQARHKPEGRWVQATTALSVYGVQYRRDAAQAFASAVKAADRQGRTYGASLELEPNNKADSNAIRVIGQCEVKRLFRAPRWAEWHIGYLDRETAAELHRDYLDNGTPISVELYSIYRSGDFLDIKVIVLAPPGHGLSQRNRRKGG